MSQYPEDIRNYDNDPRSPFYEEEIEDVGYFDGEEHALVEEYLELKWQEEGNE